MYGGGLRLQQATPGVQDVGNANINGTMMAGRFRTPYPSTANPKSVVIGSWTAAYNLNVTTNARTVFIGEGMSIGGLGGGVFIGGGLVHGNGLTKSFQNGVCIGDGAGLVENVYGAQGNCIVGGGALSHGGHNATAIGNVATAGGSAGNPQDGGVAIGNLANSSKAYNVCIGSSASDNGRTNIIRIGVNGLHALTTDSQISIGDVSHVNVFIGPLDLRKRIITGSRGGNAALANLLTALATMNLITDSTTA